MIATHDETAEIVETSDRVTFRLGDATWHDGPGWYYTIDDYPDEGSCGAFATRQEAAAHAAGKKTTREERKDGQMTATHDDWTRRIDRLWSQDDAVPHEDTPERAWRRLFGGSMPSAGSWVASVDRGDHRILLDADGCAYTSSYPGANEIGVLCGSPASVLPRLIISGGQTGADRGAMDAALEVGFPVGGWAPEGWIAEGGCIPDRYRQHMVELRREIDDVESMRPTSAQAFRDRTIRNIEESDGTLILSMGRKISGGSALTMREAMRRKGENRFLHLHIADDLVRASAPGEIFSWVRGLDIGVLNVAGPRESKETGIHALAREVMREFLALVQAEKRRFGRLSIVSRIYDARVEADADFEADADLDDPIDPGDDDGEVVIGVQDSEGDEDGDRGSSPAISKAFVPSPDQEDAIRSVSRWMSDLRAPQVYRLFGPAGTGKSTLVRSLVDGALRPWLYASYTGKAALVMRQKGCAGAQTIHSLIYRPGALPPDSPAEADAEAEGEKRRRGAAGGPRVGAPPLTSPGPGAPGPEFRLWGDSPLSWAPGLVIDECSMVDREVGEDLLSFGRKILVLGDPAQLPPIRGGGFFTEEEPDFLLTQVHRQARDSGILDLATHIREGGDLMDRLGWRSPAGDCEVVLRDRWTSAQIMTRMVKADQVIVGTNRTRHAFNDRYRRMSGISSPLPVAGDRLICLRNERRTGLLNGSRWRVLEVGASSPESSVVELRLATLDGTSPGEIATRSWAHHFLGRESALDEMGPSRMGFQEFDFGYYVTCHKAQGSQWDDVVLYDESRTFRDPDTRRRWIYTGITRAARRILVIA